MPPWLIDLFELVFGPFEPIGNTTVQYSSFIGKVAYSLGMVHEGNTIS